jgi:hypothetical protein
MVELCTNKYAILRTGKRHKKELTGGNPLMRPRSALDCIVIEEEEG